MKRYFFIVLVCCLSLSIWAQHVVSVSGKVVSAADGSIIEMATIRLMNDSVLAQGAQTDADGEFYLTQVHKGNYRLLVSSVGYIEHEQKVQVTDKDVQVATIRLNEDVHALAEVDIKGYAAEMTVKGDTIEYNTAAYKVQDGAMVEELLKKMNGVEVDKEGNIQVNGEKITAVRIDGKKFFGSDVQSATKNIPADMIDKIQVIDQKSDMARLTGFDDDETERIINLSLKKDRKKGVFGNYTGGIGADLVADNGKWFGYDKHFMENDFRYTANVFTNLLLGESQTTILGGANNTNEIRTGRGRGGWSGGQNSGITRAENIGVNTNIDLTSKLNGRSDASLLFGGDASMNHSINDSRTLSTKESYSEGLTYHNRDTSSSLSHAWDAQMRLEVEWQIDSLNKLLFKPNISYTDSRSNGHSEYLYQKEGDTISNGYQNKREKSHAINSSLEVIYNHKFHKPGRTLTVNANVGFSNTTGTGRTFAWDQKGDSARVDQFSTSRNNNLNYSIKASYVEPIYGKNHFLETVLNFSGRNRESQKMQYRDSAQTVLDSVFSNRFSNAFYSESLELNYRWIEENYDLMVGLRINPSQTLTSTTYMDARRGRDTLVNVWNFSPNVNFKYKFGKKEFARIIYRGTTNQPTINQMEPVRNNSEAMNETVGNLNLNPAFQHNLRLMYSKYNETRMSSIMTGVRGTLTKDALVNNTIYDTSGKQYQQTVNADILPWNISADLMYNTPFANKMLQFNTRTAISYNQRVAYLSHEQNADTIAAMIEENRLLLGDRSLTGNLQVQENASLRFTHDIVDIGLRANFTYSRTQNNLRKSDMSNVFNWGITGDLEFHLPKNWTIATDCGYTARYGYNLNDVNEILWNASVTKSWTNATLTLRAEDLLNNRKNIVQVVGENYVQYKKYNTLPTYVMLTFTYKLNKMGDLKAKGSAGFMQEMIESGAKPGTPPRGVPPMGPPPGM